MTKPSANITEAEWPIMSLLWKKGTATSAEIVQEIQRGRDVSMRTVKALINRLVEYFALRLFCCLFLDTAKQYAPKERTARNGYAQSKIAAFP
jgi:hypothetical protein